MSNILLLNEAPCSLYSTSMRRKRAVVRAPLRSRWPVCARLRYRHSRPPKTLPCESVRAVCSLVPTNVARCSNGSYNAFHPVLDGKTISIRPTPSILQGVHSRVPIMVGYVKRPPLYLSFL